MPKLVIYKNSKGAEPTVLSRIYIGTHAKLTQISAETGLSMTRVAQICVDYALENIEYSNEKAPFYTVEKVEGDE